MLALDCMPENKKLKFLQFTMLPGLHICFEQEAQGSLCSPRENRDIWYTEVDIN